MMGDRKNRVNMILGPKPEDKQEEGGDDSALKSCMSEFIDAVKAGDVDSATAAFKSCFMELDNDEGEEPPDEVK